MIAAQRQRSHQPTRQTTDTFAGGTRQIALCPPEFSAFQQAMNGQRAEATYIIQRYIAVGLEARGHHLSFVAPRNLHEIVCTREVNRPTPARQSWSASRWFDLISRNSWRVQRLMGIPYLNLFANGRLYDACLHCLPGHELVYERNSLYKFGIALACKRLRLPYVLYFEADDILEHDLMGQPITGLLRWQARQAARYNLTVADCVICVSNALKKHLVTTWRISPAKIVVLPNVADVQRFQPNPVARAAMRAALGVDEQPLIIFVGNFYKWHDVTTLLTAFAQLLSVRPTVRLLLVGDGVERPAMMRYATHLGIEQAVHFTGLVPHTAIPDLLAAADIAVVPYPPMQTDLWLSPLKLFEYMAAGKAIVASAVGQLTDVIHEGHNGLLVAPGASQAMATALQRLLDEPALRQRLGEQARLDAIRKHSWAHYLTGLESVFTAVLTGQASNQINLGS